MKVTFAKIFLNKSGQANHGRSEKSCSCENAGCQSNSEFSDMAVVKANLTNWWLVGYCKATLMSSLSRCFGFSLGYQGSDPQPCVFIEKVCKSQELSSRLENLAQGKERLHAPTNMWFRR